MTELEKKAEKLSYMIANNIKQLKENLEELNGVWEDVVTHFELVKCVKKVEEIEEILKDI